MANLAIYPKIQILFNGKTVANGSAAVYQARSSTPLPAYKSDGTLWDDSTNIPLDEDGKADIWLPDGITYTLTFKDSDGRLITGQNDLIPIINPTTASLVVDGGLLLTADLTTAGYSLVTKISSKPIRISPAGTGVTNITNLQLSSTFNTFGYNVIMTTAKSFLDSNSNALLTFTKTSSAVNYVTISNNQSGFNPTIGVGGSDSNIGLKLTPKGTGKITINTTTYPVTAPGSTSVLQSDGAGTASYASYSVAGLTIPRNYIDGCILSNNSTRKIDIAVGNADSSDNSTAMVNASTLTKDLNSGWTSGSGNGGRATGVSLTANTWYQVFLLCKSDGTGIDAGFDTSSTAANLLATAGVVSAGITKYRYLGSIKTDGSSNILAFKQIGDLFIWLSPPTDYNAVASSQTSSFNDGSSHNDNRSGQSGTASFTGSVPTNTSVEIIGNLEIKSAVSNTVTASIAGSAGASCSVTANGSISNCKCGLGSGITNVTGVKVGSVSSTKNQTVSVSTPVIGSNSNGPITVSATNWNDFGNQTVMLSNGTVYLDYTYDYLCTTSVSASGGSGNGNISVTGSLTLIWSTLGWIDSRGY